MKWDYYKLPESKIPYVEQLLENGDLLGLLRIHNNYKLSKNTYCCGTAGIVTQFKKLIDERRKEKGKNHK